MILKILIAHQDQIYYSRTSRISATIDNSILIYNYWTLNDFIIAIYFYIIIDNNIFSFLFLYVICLKFKNYNLSYKLIQYILHKYINILIKCLTVIPTKRTDCSPYT
jgi:hypothetical protein